MVVGECEGVAGALDPGGLACVYGLAAAGAAGGQLGAVVDYCGYRSH